MEIKRHDVTNEELLEKIENLQVEISHLQCRIDALDSHRSLSEILSSSMFPNSLPSREEIAREYARLQWQNEEYMIFQHGVWG